MGRQPAHLTFAEFLDWEIRQEAKHEFVDGQVVAFAGGIIDHAAIASTFWESCAEPFLPTALS